MAEEANKLTLRRLEAPIHKFIKVALPTDLDRLKKYHTNILKFQQSQQWDRLHQEHINASRTVQQLRANIREMEKLCARVRAEDAAALERLVKPVRDRARRATEDFLQLRAHPVPQPALTSPPADRSPVCVSDLEQTQSCLPEIPADECAYESWDNLEENLKELSDLITTFSQCVHFLTKHYTCEDLLPMWGFENEDIKSQQEKIDSIEDNVNTAAANVEDGTRSLGKAVGFNLAVLPVAGALLGGVIGGPLGLLAGFKVAGVAAALGGGALGYASGNVVQKHRRSHLELQMKQLTAPPTEPEPDADK